MDTSTSRFSQSKAAALSRIGCSLFMGVFLSWLVQTAIERRMFGLGELFTFISDGTFHPGKLAILVVCVAACLFLGLTTWGRSCGARLNNAGEKDWVLWLVSLAVVAVFFLWALRITVLSFMTNDDTALLKIISKVPKHGLQYASGAFSNILFCGLISLFYGIDPEGWWYAGYHIVAIFSSCTIIGRCILVKVRRHDWSLLAGCLIHFFLCIGVFMYTLSQLSFTVTPAIVGSAAVALVLCRGETKKLSGRVILDVVSVILMLLCYLHRRDSGRALLCFWALAVVYQAIKTIQIRRPQWKKQLLSLALCVVAVLSLVGISRAVSRSEISYDPEYTSAEYYRSKVMDYIIADSTAEEFEAAGIPYELYVLLQSWYFMDERINTETFKTLTQLYYVNPLSDGLTETESLVSTVFSSLLQLPDALFSGSVRPCLTTLSLLLLVLSLLAFIRFGRKYWPEFLCALCALGGALVLCLYLIIKGRFVFRVYLVAFIPALITLLLMALSKPDSIPAPSKICARLLTVLSAVLIAGGSIACLISAYNVPYADEAATREDLFSTQWQVESYANEHPDILFITNSTTQNLDPLHGSFYPTNTRLWGGTGVTASSSRLYDGDFFRDDIRLMFETPGYPGYIMVMLHFLTLDNGPVYAIDEAHVTDTIFVFDFERITPGDDYTGWYEWNGMTYYFENGQALTGTHVIDGTEYEFAPAGSQAAMFYMQTEEGDVYTTKAYSLISPEA